MRDGTRNAVGTSPSAFPFERWRRFHRQNPQSKAIFTPTAFFFLMIRRLRRVRRAFFSISSDSGGSLMLNTPPKPSTLKARAVAPWESELPSFYRVHPCSSQNVTDALRDEVSYWEPRNPIFISAPTGRGKSHFLRPCSSRTRLPAIAPC